MASAARRWHLGVAAVGAFALGVQLVLVIMGVSVLVEENPPSLGMRLARFVAYFTVQSNIIVLVSAVTLARDPLRDGAAWRVLRLCGLIGIVVTGLVHWFLLRPLLDLDGWSWLTDKLLHLVVPILTVLGWLLFGPRPRVTLRVIGLALIWPIGSVTATFVVGEISGWYPYPFLDVAAQGVASVALAVAGITGLFLVVAAMFRLGDTRLRTGRAAPDDDQQRVDAAT